MNLIKRIAGDTAIYGLSTVVGRLLNYLLVPIHTYSTIISTGAYGDTGVLYSWVALLMVVLTYGFETSFFRFASNSNHKTKVYGTAMFSYIITSSIFFVVVFFNAENISALLKIPEHPNYVKWFAAILLFDVLASIPFANLRLEGKAMKFATLKSVNICVNVFFNIFFLIVCPFFISKEIATEFISKIYNPDVGIGYIFIANLLASAVALLLLLPQILKHKIKFDSSTFNKMWKYAWPLLLVGIAAMVNEVLDRILLQYYLPGSDEEVKTQIGIYNACYKLAILIALFTQAYRMAVEPMFFKLSDKCNSKKDYAQMMHLYLLVAGFALLVVVFFLDVFQYFIGEAFRVGLNVVPILLFAYLFLGLYYNLSVWYKVTDKTKFAIIMSFAGAFVTVVLNILLIPKIGYLGSAWATFAAFLVMTILSYLFSNAHYKIPYKLPQILTLLVLLVAFTRINYVLNFDGFVNYSFKVFLLLIYLFVAKQLLFKELQLKDFKNGISNS